MNADIYIYTVSIGLRGWGGGVGGWLMGVEKRWKSKRRLGRRGSLVYFGATKQIWVVAECKILVILKKVFEKYF